MATTTAGATRDTPTVTATRNIPAPVTAMAGRASTPAMAGAATTTDIRDLVTTVRLMPTGPRIIAPTLTGRHTMAIALPVDLWEDQCMQEPGRTRSRVPTPWRLTTAGSVSRTSTASRRTW